MASAQTLSTRCEFGELTRDGLRRFTLVRTVRESLRHSCIQPMSDSGVKLSLPVKPCGHTFTAGPGVLMVLQRMRLESGVKIRGVRGDVVAHKAHAFAGIENTCRGG